MMTCCRRCVSNAGLVNKLETGPDMTEKESAQELPDLGEAQQAAPEETPEQPRKPAGAGKGTTFLAFISLLLGGGALAASGYIWLTIQNSQQQTASRISTLDKAVQSTRNELDNATGRIHADIKRIDDDNRGLKASIDRAYEQIGTTHDQWSVEEVHQLLVLASDQLTLAGNAPGALAALKIADQRILDSGEPVLQPVREQLARDIASLEQVEQIDLAGISHRLKALEKSIDELPLSTRTSMPASAGQSAGKPEDATEAGQKTVWQQLGSDLSGLVRIQRLDQPTVPLLPAEQQYFVRENIKARLTTARIALLRGEQKVYLESLQQAQHWVSEYFDAGSQSSQWLAAELTALANINTAPQLPDITRSLASLESAVSETARP